MLSRIATGSHTVENQQSDNLADDVTSPVADDHLGRIFAVPDKWWGFSAVGRDEHPGACVQQSPVTSDWILLKGTGAENKDRIRPTEMLVSPSEKNCFLKDTVFDLKPRPFRSHKLRNLVRDRLKGELDQEDLVRLQSGMVRQFGLRR